MIRCHRTDVPGFTVVLICVVRSLMNGNVVQADWRHKIHVTVTKRVM